MKYFISSIYILRKIQILLSLTLFSVLLNCATPIIKAIDDNNTAKIQEELDKGADINEYKVFYYTPIIRAVIARKKDIVEFLIAKGADRDGRGSGKWGPNRLIPSLYIAATLGDVEMVKLLLAKGASPTAQAEYPWQRSEAPYVQYQAGGNALSAIAETMFYYENSSISGSPLTPTHASNPVDPATLDYYKRAIEIAKILIRDKRILADVKNMKKDAITFLKLHQEEIASQMYDVIPGNTIEERMFVDLININRPDYMKRLLAKTKPPKASKLNLLEYDLFYTGGGDLCEPKPAGVSIKYNHFNDKAEQSKHSGYASYEMIFGILLNHYPINVVDGNGRNYLSQKILDRGFYQFHCVSALVKANKLNINGVDKYGWAPIHYAVIYGSGSDVMKLLSLGANPNLKTKSVPEDMRTVFLWNGSTYHPRPNLSAKDMAFFTHESYSTLFPK